MGESRYQMRQMQVSNLNCCRLAVRAKKKLVAQVASVGSGLVNDREVWWMGVEKTAGSGTQHTLSRLNKGRGQEEETEWG